MFALFSGVKPREKWVYVIGVAQMVTVYVNQTKESFNDLTEDVDGLMRQEMKVLFVPSMSKESFPRVEEVPCSQEYFDTFTMWDLLVLVGINQISEYEEVNNFPNTIWVVVHEVQECVGRKEARCSIIVLPIKFLNILSIEGRTVCKCEIMDGRV